MRLKKTDDMFLIDKPFVSDFLIKTIKEFNFKVIATDVAKELIVDNSLNWISESRAIGIIKDSPDTPVYSNSENVITWVANNLAFTKLPNQIEQFKNKALFREMIKELFPTFRYRIVELKDIPGLEFEEEDFPFVIKPTVGFFSLGVYIVHNREQWEAAKKELNIDNLQSIYPKEVLNASTFIVEEFIDGEEYAVDCYFNREGDVVVLSVLHHKFSSGTDTSDRVYSTSKEIILKYKNEIEAFLSKVGERAELRNFPAHVELRISSSGQITPIEVNPLRFGGWCTTGDLSWNAFGINSYEYFINNKVPDWEQVFKTRADKIYSIVILNNNSGYTSSGIARFDYNLLKKDFENVVEIREIDIKKYPLFGFVFTETSKDNEKELNEILVSNLRRYIVTRKTSADADL